MKISNDCASYDPSHEGTQWLKDHAGHPVEIVGDDGDSGAMKVYRVKGLIDGTTGNAWAREIEGFNAPELTRVAKATSGDRRERS